MSSKNDIEELWVWKGGKWRDEVVSIAEERAQGNVRFVDIAWFYGNVIDYTRVVMCVMAAFTVSWQWPLTSAILIFASILLDWIDGPVARAYNQCTIFGSGVDWLADVLAPVVTMAWWVQLDPSVLPWVMIMTTIETSCCVFDFATTTKLRYPKYPERRGGFFTILDWSMPGNAYSHLGTFLWLAWPIYSMACCLDLAWGASKGEALTWLLQVTEWSMFVPAIMYGWCELAYLIHIMDHWSEPRQDINVNGALKRQEDSFPAVQASPSTSLIPPVTVSGFSSGAYFATQFQLSYSSLVTGAAIFAGGPYYCAQGDAGMALTACLNDPAEIDLIASLKAAHDYASAGTIDPLFNLARHKVFLFSGKSDEVVNPGVMKKLYTFYQKLNVTDIEAKFDFDSNHNFPTQDYGVACFKSESPFLGNCSYDGAGAALQSLFGPLQPPIEPLSKNLEYYKQAIFIPTKDTSPQSISLADTGYVYIPTKCKDPHQNCPIHLALHGCEQYYDKVGLTFVQHSGLNGWAEANGIVILYPQSIAVMVDPVNPMGCWDWWGYNDDDYANQKGVQMRFLHRLVLHFAANQAGPLLS